MIKNNALLEKYNKIWEKNKNNIKKEFDGKPVYNDKYLRAKLKSYKRKVVLIDTVFRRVKNY